MGLDPFVRRLLILIAGLVAIILGIVFLVSTFPDPDWLAWAAVAAGAGLVISVL